MGGTQAHKGFGAGLVLDMLSGGLSGGKSSHPDAPAAKGNNVVFLVLDPKRFSGRDACSASRRRWPTTSKHLPRSRVEAILLPGDPERNILKQRSADGVPLEDAHWAKLTELAGQLGVAAIPELPAGSP